MKTINEYINESLLLSNDYKLFYVMDEGKELFIAKSKDEIYNLLVNEYEWSISESDIYEITEKDIKKSMKKNKGVFWDRDLEDHLV